MTRTHRPPAQVTDRPAKPPYRVPTMVEIRRREPCGFDAVSTFSGCGGSSLGYRMAGFRMLWASEFIPAAQDTYRANAASHTVLDTRDIRDVTAAEILASTGKARGELDLFDGSPPCASFSTAGKRSEDWGTVKAYSDGAQRSDDLFFEYARLVDEVQPRVFVAENVSGLVKGVAKGYFKQILARLQECGYTVGARLLDASWLGVPQSRQRMIFIGVRSDLGAAPVFPRPLPYQYSVREALPWIMEQAYSPSEPGGGFSSGAMRPAVHPSPTLGRNPYTGNGRCPPAFVTDRAIHDESTPGQVTHDPETGQDLRVRSGKPLARDRGKRVRSPRNVEMRKLTLQELRALGGFPPDFVLTGSYGQRWERVGRAVPPVMMCHIAEAIRDGVLLPLRERGVI